MTGGNLSAVILSLFAGLFGLLLGILATVVFAQRRITAVLQLQQEETQRLLEQCRNDVAGLCATTIRMDRRMMQQEEKLRLCLENRKDPPPISQESAGYRLAIEKARSGASEAELVSECGIPLSEARLLSRLHRKTRA
jgi:hypothetical protein